MLIKLLVCTDMEEQQVGWWWHCSRMGCAQAHGFLRIKESAPLGSSKWQFFTDAIHLFAAKLFSCMAVQIIHET